MSLQAQYSRLWVTGAAFSGFDTYALGTAAEKDSLIEKFPPACDASFSYPQGTYCISDLNPSALISGDPGGIFSSDSTSIVFANISTGEINMSASTAGGPYWIYYDAPTMCRDSFVLNIDASPSPAIAGPDQTLCGTSNGLLAASSPSVGVAFWSVLGGGSTVTFPNASGSPVTGLTTGQNILAWTTLNLSCPLSRDTVILTVEASPSISNAGPDQNICANSTVLAGNSPTTGIGNWLVISGGALVTAPGTPNSLVTNLATGPNMLEWVISNGSCPVSRDTVLITVDQVPTLAFAGEDQFLCGDSTSLEGNVPTVGTGNWAMVSSNGMISVPGMANSPVTGLAAGTNVLEWVISNGTCPVSRDTVLIMVDAPPTPALAGPDQTVCADSSILAGNVPTVGSGSWVMVTGGGLITTPGMANSSVTGLATGINVLEWVTSNGICPVSRDTVIITVETAPTPALAGPDQLLCDLSTATLAGNVPAVGNGIWQMISGGAVVTAPGTANSTVTGLAAGANLLEWVTSNGICPVSRDTVIVTVDEAPTLAVAGPDQTICADSTMLAGNAPTMGNGIWQVIGGGGIVTAPGTPGSVVRGLAVGPNVFEWVTSNGSCPATRDTVIVTVEEAPTLAVADPDQLLCGVTTATLSGNVPVVGTGAWTVDSGTGMIASPNTATTGVAGMGMGINVFLWQISNGTCPVSEDTLVIDVASPPSTALAGLDQEVCTDAVTLAGNAPTVGSGTWALASGAGTVSTPASPTSLVTGLALGNNEFIWIVNNGVCPPSLDTVAVYRQFSPEVDAGTDAEVCGNTYLLQGNDAGGFAIWRIASGATFTAPTDSNAVAVVPAAGIYNFVWEYDDGVCTVLDSVEVTFTEQPAPAQAGPDQETQDNAPVVLEAVTPTSGTGTWTVWEGTGDFSDVNAPGATVTGLSPGTNVFRWTVVNGNCPPTFDDMQILQTGLSIPTGFSPNGDGVNDSYVIRGVAPGLAVQVQVFNRWGNQVFASDNYQNDWTGYNLNGGLLADDTYFLTAVIGDQRISTSVAIKR